MTSNWAVIILENINNDCDITKEARDNVDALLKNYFRPEFLNRPGRYSNVYTSRTRQRKKDY